MREYRRNQWIVVASADHIARGKESSFMQACHGKQGPLKRMKAGDGIVCYSPSTVFGGATRCQCFTAIGIVVDDEPYRSDMGGGFAPWRRNVEWAKATDAPIQPLLEELSFTAGRKNWGYQFRFGLFGITSHDLEIIAAAMKAVLPDPEITTCELPVQVSDVSLLPKRSALQH